MVFKDGSGGRRVPKSSLLGAQEVLAKGNVKRLRSPCFKACTEECLLWDWRARQETSWRTPVHVSQDGQSQCARRCPHHPLCCPWSRGALQPAAVCCIAGAIVHAHVLQLLPVGSVESDRRRMGGALRTPLPAPRCGLPPQQRSQWLPVPMAMAVAAYRHQRRSCRAGSRHWRSSTHK
jgi:hypothetical protein